MNKWLVLLLVPFLFAGDYVCHKDGTITSKAQSVGAKYSTRKDCVPVTREVLNSVTKFHEVADGKVIEMKQVDKDALIQAEVTAVAQAKIDAVDNYEVNVKDLIEALVVLDIVDATALKTELNK